MDDDIIEAALDAIKEKRAGEVAPAVLKQVTDAGYATHDDPPALTDQGEEKLKAIKG